MERLEFHRALEEIWTDVRRVNQYLEETAPWSLGKRGDRAALAVSLYNALEAIRIIAVHLSPFMPRTAEAILRRLRLGAPDAGAAAAWEVLPEGAGVDAGDPLFPRLNI
jgi:methionyl-tRNA synthetase